jgi:hypothetical protein
LRRYSLVTEINNIPGLKSSLRHRKPIPNDAAPRPLPPPSLVSKLSLFLSLPVYRRSSLLAAKRGSEGAGVEPNYTTARKAWTSINRSILSGERDYTVRVQSNVWRLPKSTPSPPGECEVNPPAFGAEGGHTRRVERGWGVNNSEDATQDTALYAI